MFPSSYSCRHSEGVDKRGVNDVNVEVDSEVDDEILEVV